MRLIVAHPRRRTPIVPSLLGAIEKPTPTALRSTIRGYTSARSRATMLVITAVILMTAFEHGATNFLSRLAISR